MRNGAVARAPSIRMSRAHWPSLSSPAQLSAPVERGRADLIRPQRRMVKNAAIIVALHLRRKLIGYRGIRAARTLEHQQKQQCREAHPVVHKSLFEPCSVIDAGLTTG